MKIRKKSERVRSVGGFGKLGSHRKADFSARSVMIYISHSIARWLYVFGACVEIVVKRFFKRFGKGAARVLRAVFGALAGAARFVFRHIKSVAVDLFAPAAKGFKSLGSLLSVLKETRGKSLGFKLRRIKLFFSYGWRWNRHLVHRMLNYLLPALSLVLCVFVVGTVTRLNYALEVNYNGQTIGYVADESVYSSARKIVESRMITDAGSTWTANARLNITVVDRSRMTSQDVIAEQMLSVSGAEIAEATGLYVGGSFYGATAAGDLLENEIEAAISPYRLQASELGGDIEVKYKRDVELVRGIFPASSILPYDDLKQLVYSDEPTDIYYEASSGELLSDIALKNGISVDDLMAMNPGVGTVVTGDVRLLVAEGEPLFNIRTVRRIERTEEIPFETIVTRDDRYPNTFVFPITTGQSGERTIVTEIEYENGEEISRRVVSDEVTLPAVNSEIIVGGRLTGGGSGTGDGVLGWPTGPGWGISRGYSYNESGYLHGGVDIWGSRGTPIYAADDGVVITSGWTDTGYGYYVIIDHGNGMMTLYGHNSTNLVSVGDYVGQGDMIALMGSTGNSTGDHLHFEVRLRNADGSVSRVDPNLYLHYYS